MRVRLIWILAAWLFAVIPGFAQSPPQVESPGTLPPQAANDLPALVTPDPNAPALPDIPPKSPDAFGFWVRGDYLAYWVKSAPLPVSLVTGDPNNPTQELLNSNQKLGMLPGFRISVGAWLDSDYCVGLEASVFSLSQQTRKFFTSSDSAGNPTLGFPFTNQTPGVVGYTMLPIAMPGLFAGSVQAVSSISLWGTEANGSLALFRQGGLEVVALAGIRTLDLQERLSINTLSINLVTAPVTPLFLNDQFSTRNQFYGAQIGTRATWQGERFGFDVTGKLALGATHQSVDIQGYSTQTGPGGVNGTFPGGFFTQPSNIGRHSGNAFTVVPSIEMKLYARITANWRAFVGYDFLYWSSVARPGAQIDRNINLSQSAILGSGVLSGPASPLPLLSHTDFWAQGVSLGLEFRF